MFGEREAPMMISATINTTWGVLARGPSVLGGYAYKHDKGGQ